MRMSDHDCFGVLEKTGAATYNVRHHENMVRDGLPPQRMLEELSVEGGWL